MNIALITARGGSKGLPRKNILPLCGMPLIGWSIKAAIDSKYIDRVFVSTEDEEITKISLQLGAEIIARPESLALDTSSSDDVIAHSIRYLEIKGVVASDIILLQPTSPLRTCKHIDELLELHEEKKSNCTISVFEPSHSPIKAYVELEDGSISGLFHKEAPNMRRQDLPRAFQPNGAIYAFSIVEFKKYNQIPKNKVYPYIMSECDSADIDTLNDLINVELTLKSKNND